MKTSFSLTFLAAFITLAAMPIVGRAAESGSEASDSGAQAQEAQKKMEALRAEISKVRNQVTVMLEELNRLKNKEVELRPQLDRYAAELEKTQAQADIVSERADALHEKGSAFFGSWGQTISTIQNPQIRKDAEKRLQQRSKSYAKITQASMQAKAQFKPFMSDLNDIKKMLDAELTRESVKSANPTIKSANTHGAEVKSALTAVEKELDRVGAELKKNK